MRYLTCSCLLNTDRIPSAIPQCALTIIFFFFMFRYHMVDQEDGEESVVDIVNEIVEYTSRVLHDQYISQTLPYTI